MLTGCTEKDSKASKAVKTYEAEEACVKSIEFCCNLYVGGAVASPPSFDMYFTLYIFLQYFIFSFIRRFFFRVLQPFSSGSGQLR